MLLQLWILEFIAVLFDVSHVRSITYGFLVIQLFLSGLYFVCKQEFLKTIEWMMDLLLFVFYM